MLIKTKVSPMKEWPSPKGSPVGPRHKAATPGKSLTIFEKESVRIADPGTQLRCALMISKHEKSSFSCF